MKKNKVPGIVTIAILTLITIVFWIFFNVYRVFTIKPPTPVPEEILAPLDPNLDMNVLSKLSERRYVDENTIPDTQIQIRVETTPSFLEEPNPTEEAIPTETPTQSPTPTSSPIGETSEIQ
jgi:hypothetical protein